jgi:hypothetical protein
MKTEIAYFSLDLLPVSHQNTQVRVDSVTVSSNSRVLYVDIGAHTNADRTS